MIDYTPALRACIGNLRAESDAAFARGRETPNTIPVGAALFDHVLVGAVRLELLAALDRSETIEQAHALAADAVRLWVTKHNARRAKDRNWQRWTEAGQDDLERCVRRVRESAAGGDARRARGVR